MQKTQWNERRLERLFERYNQKFWRGQLPRYRLRIATLGERLGQCDWKKKLIEIDIEANTNDRQIRCTLLHEMVHAATRTGHGVKFFAQIERLMRRGALITIETGDAGGVKFYGGLVPRRFPLLRKKMERLERLRVNAIKRITAKKKVHVTVISDDELAAGFKDVEIAELPWKTALRVVGYVYGLTDDTGRPTSARARRILARGEKIHRSARRYHLEYERLRARFEKRF